MKQRVQKEKVIKFQQVKLQNLNKKRKLERKIKHQAPELAKINKIKRIQQN